MRAPSSSSRNRRVPVPVVVGVVVTVAAAVVSGLVQAVADGGRPAGGREASTAATDAGQEPFAPSSSTARAVLDSLPVRGRAPKTGYDRVLDFGRSWLDVDQNGCDTRNDVLARDLGAVVRSGACTVLSGRLVSVYSGVRVSFTRGPATSAEVQIDHIVPLSNAWQTGARQLPQARREALANDPLNLQAVEGSLNEQKSDGDAASWLPPLRSYRCIYVARQISVKAAYDLWVTAPERDAMRRVLDSCPAQPAYLSASR